MNFKSPLNVSLILGPVLASKFQTHKNGQELFMVLKENMVFLYNLKVN